MGFWSDTFGGGNSFSESVANVTTKNDDYEYRGGNLYDISGGGQELVKGEDRGGKTSYGTLGQADSKGSGLYYPSNVGGGEGPGAGKQSVRNTSGFNAGLGSITRNPIVMGGLGLISGGIVPAIASGAMAAGRRNMYNNTAKPDPLSNQQVGINKAIRSVEDIGPSTYTKDELTKIREGKNRIEGSYYKDGQGDKQFKMNMFGNSYEINPETGNSKLIEDQAAAAGGEGGIPTVRRSVGTQATAPTNNMPAISAMSEAAASGAFMPIPDPNYDPNDPMSSKYIINPTYDQIAEYQKSILGMAKGGEVESALGGNEKDLINDAEKAIRGELDETRAAIILAQYVQQYGEGALMNLVDSVRTGEADETRAQFASGKNGMVRGNGDGSGVDDMVTAQLKDGDSTQDVLLADGEFVMRKDATDSLQKAYGDGMLDKINDAGPNAAAALKKYLTG